MISNYLCFDLYTALNLHFTTTYDFFKYQGKTKTTKEGFLARKDRYFFERVAAKCIDEQDCVELFVSNIVANDFKRIYIKNISYPEYVDYKTKRDNLFYQFKDTISKLRENNTKMFCRNGEYSEIFSALIGEEISIEHFIILNHITKNAIINNHDKELKDDIIWQEYKRKLLTYYPFLCYYWNIEDSNTIQKLKNILKNSV